jgi:hypothetical protein
MKTIFKCISGSKAYGTDLPGSDTDERGVFMLPNRDLFKVHYQGQIGDKKNDVVHYELKRFFELAGKSNPNVLEFLFMPEENIIDITKAWWDILCKRDMFVTKQLRRTLGGYAIAQIKKARGLNKMIVNPMEVERKTPIDFCYVIDRWHSSPLKDLLFYGSMEEERCGLAKIPHAKGMYCMKYDVTPNKDKGYRGICQEDSNELRMSSLEVDDDEKTIAHHIVYYDKDGYTQHCKAYKKYWEWVEKRNPERFKHTEAHGKGYDGKNMMHCRRLLDMALEIAETGSVNVVRPNARELIKIRLGEKDYDQLIAEAEADIEKIDEAFDKSDLPENINHKKLDELLIQIREQYGDF